MFDLIGWFSNKPKVNLPALIPPAGPPAVIDAGRRYDLEILPPASPPVPVSSTAQLKVKTEFRDGPAGREIVVIFKNKSRHDFQGGEFTFRVKQGWHVVRQSCHDGYRIGRGPDSYYEKCYTYIGCLRPGEYEEVYLPGYFDKTKHQKVEISLL